MFSINQSRYDVYLYTLELLNPGVGTYTFILHSLNFIVSVFLWLKSFWNLMLPSFTVLNLAFCLIYFDIQSLSNCI